MKMQRLLILALAVMLAALLAACGGGETASTTGGSQAAAEPQVSAGDPVAGEQQYNSVCIACHGTGGTGVPNLGKPFTTSEFVTTSSDADLLAFIKKGRPIGDPANTTGVDMPPKGGNPALSDEQILDIIAYIRTLHE